MNRDKLELELIYFGAGRPRLEWTFIPLSFFLALLFPFVTGDFKDAFGVPAFAWQALSIGMLSLSFAFTVATLVAWIYWQIRYPAATPKRRVQEVVSEFEKARKKAEAEFYAKQAALKDAAPPATPAASAVPDAEVAPAPLEPAPVSSAEPVGQKQDTASKQDAP